MQAQLKHPIFPAVPWKFRDFWFGLVFFLLWLLSTYFFSTLINKYQVGIESGVVVLISELLLILPVWGLTIQKYHAGWDTLGLVPFKASFVGLGCGLIAISYCFNLIYGLLVLLPLKLNMQGELVPRLASTPFSIWLLLGFTIAAPFVEELYFRGFFYAGLRQHFGWKKSAFISAALFSLAHMQLTAVLPIFVLGFFLALLYERSRSLWPSIVMHMTINLVSFAAVYLIYQ